jgi:kynurenine formamidase
LCDACVIESVKARMLSRRDVFRGAAATSAAAAVAATVGAPAVLAQAHGSVEDMTHELGENFPTFFGGQQFFLERQFDFASDGFNLFEMRVNEHTGTHMDAPLHFSEGGQSVAQIPVTNLVVPLCVVDIRAKADADPDAQLTPDDISTWIAQHGDIPDRACVAMNSGWGERVLTDRFRNADQEGKLHFPGFHVETVQMLLEETRAVGIAVDTLSLDHGISPDFATHYAWLSQNRWGLEAVANLDRVPAVGATLVVGAPKHTGGTGGPARILALV